MLFRSLEDKKDNLEIDVSQVRDALKFLSYKSYNGGYKIVIIDNADRMNVEAQSCFLKTLEEPKGQTLLLLVSSKPDMLLETIASRCQTLKFFKGKNSAVNTEKLEEEKEILKELLLVLNADLAEKFKFAKNFDFEKRELSDVLEVMQKYFRSQLLNDFSDKKAKKFLEVAEDINKKLLFTNINQKLALEIILMEI